MNEKSINWKAVGERLRSIRAGTQSEFAEKFGTDQEMVSRYENGKNPVPVEILFKVSLESGKSIDWLLGKEVEGKESRASEEQSTPESAKNKQEEYILRRWRMIKNKTLAQGSLEGIWIAESGLDISGMIDLGKTTRKKGAKS